jgi:hypothetical protein
LCDTNPLRCKGSPPRFGDRWQERPHQRFSLLSPGSFLSLQALGSTAGGDTGGGGGGDMSGMEQQNQVFLSRLLLMLGSFVIMCLLLF